MNIRHSVIKTKLWRALKIFTHSLTRIQPLQTFPEQYGLSVLFYACWRQRIQFWREKLSETGPNMSEILANYMIFST